ncbi:hypothetical protein AAFF_G00207230 [Aldrovandia affinis]|uniref:Uncharacterized protein n=1 Tax=Aldrovandia affinis TaxID=143900 RepID=A0AAD7RHZ7_9TELE|nr:hypothetical protein AAFF_G00207230 [Aldrovandia affinis]
MMGVPLLSWTLLLVASQALWAHPIADSSEVLYTGRTVLEEGGEISPGELSLSDQRSQSGTDQGFRSLLTEELDRHALKMWFASFKGVRAAGYIPIEAVEEVLMEKQGQLHPFQRFLGSGTQHAKRGNPAECFWKYCV